MTRLAPSSEREALLLHRLHALDAQNEPSEFEVTCRLARLQGELADGAAPESGVRRWEDADDSDAERISSTGPIGTAARWEAAREASSPWTSAARHSATSSDVATPATRLSSAERSFGRRATWPRRLMMVAASPLLFGGFAFAWELQRVLIESIVDAPPALEEPREPADPARKRSTRRARPTATLTLPPPAEVPELEEELVATPPEAEPLDALSLDSLPTETSDDATTTETTAPAPRAKQQETATPPVPTAAVPTATWSTVAAAMRAGDTASALRDLDRLVAQTRGTAREAAELARAQLWLTTGEGAKAHAALEKLANQSQDPLVRSRAAKLLGAAASTTANP